MNSHLHNFKFDSKTINGHNHRLLGYTDTTLGINMFHFHYFWGICAYRGHTHYYSGFTGLPQKTEDGHIHKIEGILELNNCHEHKFTSFTSEEIQQIPKKSAKTAIV